MRCPYCQNKKDSVIDSRMLSNASGIRRRRECLKCKRRFTTYEYVERIPLMVIKKDGRREAFDREKLMSGILVACEKRPISVKRVERLVDDIERSLEKKHEKEIASNQIGELVMKGLHSIDEIAYVRFASVYRQFRDVGQFMKELKTFLK
ncbi:MAG: transcriptional regulator NrdR [Omnitrophica bacterium RIFCSPLOWO2_02_FULL_45_16]|nr:MAG: transcriptional regulator NrdR [Omnitrophica bacterium RIFCSPHIGHO2_02_FULL_46_20]OGW93270.1 MAG: transcriptional regulator NrdR [Omnitrophica bacterium RIFCSPLOWO2_01_FULL_45_24]OGW94751.1 MAG: transcriptional regulator NrdR [Omnitrophica bacterium RIFCSPLOWO2_12_FULL_45_13]OGX01082.1 MAG: transcriptional regulator NrdR [Omnitrophica bacterium RIFCSPLOWO2_02_FULL_45_16]